MISLHPIEQFLVDNHIGKMAFAKSAEVSPGALSRLFNGKRDRVGLDACLRLVAATGGKVTLEALVLWRKPEGLAERDGRLKPRRTAPRRSR